MQRPQVRALLLRPRGGSGIESRRLLAKMIRSVLTDIVSRGTMRMWCNEHSPVHPGVGQPGSLLVLDTRSREFESRLPDKMPVRLTTVNGQPAYQWGEHGHKYVFNPNDSASRARAKAKAERQGRAARANGAN